MAKGSGAKFMKRVHELSDDKQLSPHEEFTLLLLAEVERANLSYDEVYADIRKKRNG